MLHLDEHGEGKPRRAVDDDAAEDDSADEHPIAAADRPEDNDDSEGERRSSDDWSTLSEELSEETREGRPDADPRERPVDLGSVEREEDTREWQQLTTDGGVRKRVAQAGSGPHPNDHFTVDVKWVLLRAHDGSLVDVSVNEMWPNKVAFCVSMSRGIDGRVGRGVRASLTAAPRNISLSSAATKSCQGSKWPSSPCNATRWRVSGSALITRLEMQAAGPRLPPAPPGWCWTRS